MDARVKGLVGGLVALAVGVAVANVLTPAQSAANMAAPGKTAAQVYKNIQVLNDIPADQLLPTMQFMATSLGVRCSFCHVEGDFSKDDKPTKHTARKMIRMELAIDQANFNGRTEVTCYTCHRGASHPLGVPALATVAMETESGEEMSGGNASASRPTPDQILAKYVEALGGASALQEVSSRVEKGTLTAGGHQFPIEVFTKAPYKRIAVVHLPSRESFTAYDGRAGWLGSTGRPAHMLTDGDLNVMRLDADFHFALNVKQLYPHLRERRPEKVGDQEAWVLMGFGPGQAPVKLYFDQQSGLLIRREAFVETPLGPNPIQTDFADYRETDGIKTPYQWTIARPEGRFTIQINSVEQNVPIEDSKFAAPAGATAAVTKPASH
jgi:photosynthetic reaction center cytochrome c subunit